jgi:L-seryl-tRNA(Ser) seleniumtransferase
MSQDLEYRKLPKVDQLLDGPAGRSWIAAHGRDAALDAIRDVLGGARAAIAGGAPCPGGDALVAGVAQRLADAARPSLRPVINATGVIIHTNLGRAPIAPAAIDRVVEVARGYSSLEYDLGGGERGRRDVHAEALLRRLTGAEAAVVVNNNAAATMIVLAALAAGREVIVSRGELVEIGGGFRVPDVMAQSGATLREVGTTNKTRASDYGAAITDRTALILRVHPSNFRIEGFTERPLLQDLVALGRKFNIPVAEDLGSGYLPLGADRGQSRGQIGDSPRDRSGTDPGTDPWGQTGVRHPSGPPSDPLIGSEPAVRTTVEAGVDVCCFSGDKLLGGPQAGIIVGRAAIVDRIRKHPLMRALRVDKMTYAALEATLAEYAAGRAATTIPVQRMLMMTADEIRIRADALVTEIGHLPGWRAALVTGQSAIGGGSAPGVELPTSLVAIAKEGVTPDALEERLRRLTPPVIARIERERLLLDLRTVLPGQERQLAALLGQA